MTRIGNVDQIMLLLRQQLQRMDKAGGKSRSGKAGRTTRNESRTATDRVVPLARIEDLDEREFERALIRALLADEFGPAVAEDYRFERVASEVQRLIASDQQTREMLIAAVRQARAKD